MLWRNSNTRYGAVAKSFHWVIGLGILFMLGMGLMLDGMESADRRYWMPIHKALGITILGLAVLRLFWAGIAGRPAKLPGAPWQHRAASAVHVALYVLMLAVPLSGWLLNSAAGYPLSYFGLGIVPNILAADEDAGRDLRGTFGSAHYYLAYALLGLVVLHVLAALQHHVLLRDDTLRRMIPFGRPRPLAAPMDPPPLGEESPGLQTPAELPR